MYYEKRTVKNYPRKNKKTGHVTPIYKIDLTSKTAFKKDQPVAVVSLETLENILNNMDTDEIDRIRKENKELHEKLNQVPEVVDIQREYNREITRLNKKIRKQDKLINALSIAYTELRNRGVFGRIRNKPPENYQVIDGYVKQLKGVIIENSKK